MVFLVVVVREVTRFDVWLTREEAVFWAAMVMLVAVS